MFRLRQLTFLPATLSVSSLGGKSDINIYNHFVAVVASRRYSLTCHHNSHIHLKTVHGTRYRFSYTCHCYNYTYHGNTCSSNLTHSETTTITHVLVCLNQQPTNTKTIMPVINVLPTTALKQQDNRRQRNRVTWSKCSNNSMMWYKEMLKQQVGHTCHFMFHLLSKHKSTNI